MNFGLYSRFRGFHLTPFKSEFAQLTAGATSIEMDTNIFDNCNTYVLYCTVLQRLARLRGRLKTKSKGSLD